MDRPAPDLHVPFVERRRRAGNRPDPFRPHMRGWVLVGFLTIVATLVVPLVWPAAVVVTLRVGPLLAVGYLFSAAGLWMRLGRRAFPVGFAMAAGLYLLTAWTPLAFPLDDAFVLALLMSLLVFGLAGFNIVFLLEEVVFDAHRLMHFRHPAWSAAPLAALVLVAVGIPVVRLLGGPHLVATWVTSLVAVAFIGSWWLVRAFNDIRGGVVLQELHLLAIGALLASAVADGFGFLRQGQGLLPSVVAYMVLVGSWVYVTYTTLQRTHFLLPGTDPLPWLAVLFAASFAIISHVQAAIQVQGPAAAFTLNVLVQRRVSLLVTGIWVGMAFYVVQSLWRVVRSIRDQPALSGRFRIAAGRTARFLEGVVETERRVGGIMKSMVLTVEHILPGHKAEAFELDVERGTIRPELPSDSEE